MDKPFSGAYLHVTMEDGSIWAVSADIIAVNRARYFAEQEAKSGGDYGDALNREFDYTIADDYELMDWAANNMNWSDVASHAVQVYTPPRLSDEQFQQGWVSGEQKVVR